MCHYTNGKTGHLSSDNNLFIYSSSLHPMNNLWGSSIHMNVNERKKTKHLYEVARRRK